MKLASLMRPNAVDEDLTNIVKTFDENAPLPRAVDFPQVLACFLRFLKKPLRGLYWDVVDKVYISSKARDINIEGPYIRSLFAAEKSHSVIMDVLRKKILNDIAFDKDIVSYDIDFLLTKYMTIINREGG